MQFKRQFSLCYAYQALKRLPPGHNTGQTNRYSHRRLRQWRLRHTGQCTPCWRSHQGPRRPCVALELLRDTWAEEQRWVGNWNLRNEVYMQWIKKKQESPVNIQPEIDYKSFDFMLQSEQLIKITLTKYHFIILFRKFPSQFILVTETVAFWSCQHLHPLIRLHAGPVEPC